MCPRRSTLLLLASLAGLFSACSRSSSGSGSSPASQPFELLGVSFAGGATLQLNEPIELRFNQPVDLLSATGQTFSLATSGGLPAVGSVGFKQLGGGMQDERVLVFTPRCPRERDLADAGLEPFENYRLRVAGGADPTVLRSRNGDPLRDTFEAFFLTVNSTDSGVALRDEVPGPATPVVRARGASLEEACYVEIGSPPSRRVYLELDPAGGASQLEGGLALPLNLYAVPETRVVFALRFNQAIRGDELNLARVGLEYRTLAGDWRALETRVEFGTACTGAGDELRLEPVGVLPADRELRVVVRPGFQDLVGETLLVGLDDFAALRTRVLSHPGFTPAQAGADEFREDFDFGRDDERSFQSDRRILSAAGAEWGDGTLASSLGLRGGGGPGGNFDLIVRSGEVIFLNTAGTALVGGPGGVPTAVQTVTDGLLEVRDLHIEEGGVIRVTGPFPLVVEATGTIEIDGRLDASGMDALSVATLNTGNLPSVGGAGVAGGGSGGIASGVTTASTPGGGAGSGAFGRPEAGGQGGESGFSSAANGKDARRPGGGGGGRFARDQGELVAENGFDGAPVAFGALTGLQPPRGGMAGPGPFMDADPANDFFGEQPVLGPGNQVIGTIRGELSALWAGSGGGGGGDAVPSSVFPQANWNPGSDEKGGGGGGGGGGVHLRSLGPIVFGQNGTLLAVGGRGGTGENTNFLDHVGGSGGAGSGGHVILESATRVDFSQRLPVQGEFQVAVSARGGRRTTGAATSGGDVSFGGAGGPGVIQINVPKPTLPPGATPQESNILLPAALLAEADPLAAVTRPTAVPVLPTVGSRSLALSRWIPVGAAGDGTGLLSFLFGGTETAAGEDEGKVSGLGAVRPPGAILGPIAGTHAGVSAAESGALVRFQASALDGLLQGLGDLYLRTPRLLRDFELRLDSALPEPSIATVVAATFDDSARVLELRVTPPLPDLGTGVLRLVPRFFRLRTDGVDDALPPTGYVRVLFQAAADDGSGAPDEDALLVDWTADVSRFNGLEPGALAYFRFQVEFELDAAQDGIGPDAPRVELDFLRLPFRF